MAIKIIKPTSNARRQMSVTDFSMLDKVKPAKRLTIGKRRVSGRNSLGQVVVYDRGGGAKRLYRLVDFSGVEKLGEKATVETVEYDPNRTAFIAKIKFEDESLSYIIAPEGLKKDAVVICDEKAPIRLGNRMKLKNIPVGTEIHNVELVAGKGGQLARSAGNAVTLLGFDDKYAIVRLPSGESRKVLAENYASIGVVSNTDHANIVIGTAGRTRKMGRRPHVLGKSKNPADHPHGGGEGHTSIGLKYPKTPWGAPALGRPTRNKKKQGSKLILSRRKK